jgi:hypothetical protein
MGCHLATHKAVIAQRDLVKLGDDTAVGVNL